MRGTLPIGSLPLRYRRCIHPPPALPESGGRCASSRTTRCCLRHEIPPSQWIAEPDRASAATEQALLESLSPTLRPRSEDRGSAATLPHSKAALSARFRGRECPLACSLPPRRHRETPVECGFPLMVPWRRTSAPPRQAQQRNAGAYWRRFWTSSMTPSWFPSFARPVRISIVSSIPFRLRSGCRPATW
jgi:hypothetical protein